MPYIIIKASPFCISPSWKTVVGDKDSDPKLMASLNAVLDTQFKTYNRYYRTSLSPRLVLDRLEVEGYKVVGVQTTGTRANEFGSAESFSQWTLHKPNMIPLIPLYDFPISERMTEM